MFENLGILFLKVINIFIFKYFFLKHAYFYQAKQIVS